MPHGRVAESMHPAGKWLAAGVSNACHGPSDRSNVTLIRAVLGGIQVLPGDRPGVHC